MSERSATRTFTARAGWLSPLGPCLLLSACTTAHVVDLDGRDDSVLFTDTRLSMELGADESAGQSGKESDPGDGVFLLELDLSHGEGQDEISLPPGQVIVFGGQVYRGESLAFFDLTRVMVDIRNSYPTTDGIAIEGFIGLEYTSLDMTLRESGEIALAQQGSKTVASLGPALGGALVWRPSELLRFSVEGQVSLGLSSAASCVQLLSLEAGLGILPFEHVGFFLGWRSVRYEVELDGPSLYGLGYDASALDLRLAGPVIALTISL